MAQLKYWNGSAWVNAVIGAQGPQGIQGLAIQGIQGAQGIQGGGFNQLQGTTGATGATGSTSGQPVVYNSGTTSTSSASEQFNFNTVVGSVNPSIVYLTHNVGSVISAGDIISIVAGSNYIYLSVSGTPTLLTSTYTIPVTVISIRSGGVWTNGATYSWTTSKRGIQGIQGTQSTQGIQGVQGLKIGFTYNTSAPVSPSAGDIWVDSTDGTKYQYFNDGDSSQWVELDSIGYIGSQGLQGIQGGGFNQLQGTQGTQGLNGAFAAQGIQGLQGVQGVINFPVVTQTSSYTLQSSDNGKIVSITTGGITVPISVFSAGDSIVIFNNSTSAQTITQGTSTTLRQAGTANTGNRTLAQYGVATILCVATGIFTISGAGVY